DRTQIEVQLLERDVELRREIDDGLLEAHERLPDVLGLVAGQRAGFHPADRLTLEDLADQLDERQHELQHGAPHFFRTRVPPRRLRGRDVLDLLANGFDLFRRGGNGDNGPVTRRLESAEASFSDSNRYRPTPPRSTR